MGISVKSEMDDVVIDETVVALRMRLHGAPPLPWTSSLLSCCHAEKTTDQRGGKGDHRIAKISY